MKYPEASLSPPAPKKPEPEYYSAAVYVENKRKIVCKSLPE